MRNPLRRRAVADDENEQKALTASASVVDAIQTGWTTFPLLGGGARDRVQDIYNVAQNASYGWLYSKSPAVRQVLDGVVRDVGALELRLYEEVSDIETNPRPDHPAAMSLRYPSETTTSDGLVRGLVKDFLIYDNAYAWLLPAPNDQIGVIRIPAHMIEVQGSNMFEVDNFRVWPQGAWTSAGSWGGGGSYMDFQPEQILHWHGEHPHDPRVGLSHLDTLRGVIAEDAALQQASVELAEAGFQEPVWAYRPLSAPDWSNEARRLFEEDLTSRLKGRNRKPVVLEEGIELRSFGVSPEDAQALAVRQWAVARVAAEYGVPRGKAGLDPRVSEVNEENYIIDVLAPLCKSFTSMLNQRILVRVYDWTEGAFAFNLDERAIGNARLTALVSATGRAVMLTNEARAKLNLPPTKGGDELVTPLNVQVGDNPKPSPQIMGPQNPNGPAQDGSYRSDQGSPETPAQQTPPTPKALVDPSTGAVYQLALPEGEVKASEAFPQLPRFHPRHVAEMDRQGRNVDMMKGVVQRHFNRLARTVNENGKVDDWDRMNTAFTGDLDRALRRVVDTEGGLYALKLGGADFDIRKVRNYLRAMAEGASGAINDTIRGEMSQLGTKEALARAPVHVASAGTSLGVKSTTWARKEAAQQAPNPESRIQTWIADSDRHAEFDGNTVPLGADWPAGFAPGGEPGCGCTTVIT